VFHSHLYLSEGQRKREMIAHTAEGHHRPRESYDQNQVLLTSAFDRGILVTIVQVQVSMLIEYVTTRSYRSW
jgi:hypothetical protein